MRCKKLKKVVALEDLKRLCKELNYCEIVNFTDIIIEKMQERGFAGIQSLFKFIDHIKKKPLYIRRERDRIILLIPEMKEFDFPCYDLDMPGT